MWFLIVLFVASLVASLVLTPKPKLTNASPGKLTDVSFPRADEGSPVPRWYGTAKFKGPNTIFDGLFKAVPIRKKVKTGLFSSKHQTVGFQYFLTLDMAVCLGPGFIFRRLWFGNYEIWNGCLISSPCQNIVSISLPNLYGGADSNGGVSGDIAMYCGNYDQANDDWLSGQLWPDNSNTYPSYPGVAHVVFRNFYLGNSTSIQPPYIEGACFPDSLDLGDNLIMPNGLDMNPVGILHHIITDNWGCLDIDPAKINIEQWQNAGIAIYGEGLGASLVVSGANQASEAVKELLSMMAATLFEDPATGLWDLILVRGNYVIADLPVLGPSEISAVQDLTKSLWSQTFNVVKVQFTDRTQAYKESTVAQAQDFANIRFQNKPLPETLTMESVYDPTVANTIAARELSNVNIPLFSMTLVMNRMHADLAPGSVFVWNWPEYGIVSMVLRIRKFGLGTLADGSITMDCVQDVFSASNVVMAPPAPPPIVIPDSSPKAIITYDIFELPYWLDFNSFNTPSGLQSYGIFAAAPSAYSIGFNGYVVGIDEDTQVLDQAQYNKTAKLHAALGQFDGFVDGTLPTLTIDTVSAVSVLVNDAADVRLGYGLFMLNDEILAYETFTDNGDGTYNLNNVHRALMDTIYTAGAIGDVMYFFQGADEFIEGEVIGSPFQLYLQDQTTTGLFDPDSAARIDETPEGRMWLPVPPDAIEADGVRSIASVTFSGATVALVWTPRNAAIDAGTLAFETDAAQTAPDGATYKLELVAEDGTVLVTEDAIADPNYDLEMPVDYLGLAVVKIWTVTSAGMSYNPAIYPISIVGELTIDADRVTIDGNGVIV